MNKISRLTALLLALMMILSTFAAAETSYQVGQMTTEQWQQMVEQAENELYVIEPGDSGETVMPEIPDKPVQGEYYPYTDGVTMALADEDVNCQISASGVAILTNAAAGQWQMHIGDQWVNISGAVGDSLSVTGAMMNGMECVEVRKALTSQDEAAGEVAAFTATATIEIAEPAPTALFAVSRAEATDGDSTENAAESVPYSLQRANENTTYTVIINYKFQNGMTAAAAWGASLGEGTNLDEIVANPNVVGYKPLASVVVSPADVGGVTYTPPTVATADDAATGIKAGDVTDPGSVNLAITGIDQHITVTVTYEPTLVDYTVIHKQQNTDNDNYTEVERVTERGLTGYIVPDKDIARSYPGFYSLLYEQPAIAANGSTVVEISYDRYYYLISFELFGGYGVDPVYGRFGAAVGEVGTPIRAGYTFKGWATTKEKAEAGTVDVTTLPATIPAEHTVYYAVWEMADKAKVSVVFWGENPNDEKYSYIQTGEVSAKPGEDYTYEDGDPVYMLCDLEEHTHGVDCQLKCGKEEHTSHTEQCIVCDHVHSLSCYQTRKNYTLREATPAQTINPTKGNGVYTYTRKKNTHYYLYLNGKWYCYYQNSNGNKSDTQSISECSHVHDAFCYGCEVHEHNDDCYDCGKEEHIHNNSCNQEMDGLNSKLWTFVRSETVEVAADGSSVVNVYYARTEFTMTFKKTGYNGATLATIKDKWGADIKERFETISKQHTFLWSMQSDGDSPWTSFMDVMPAENRTYYAKTTSSNNDQTATYLVQSLGKTAGVAANYETLYTVTVYYESGLSVSAEEFVEIEGFTFNDPLSTNTGEDYDGAKFYYDRNAYSIEFYNPSELIKKVDGIYYGASIENQYFVPGAELAPSQYEPGSVYFDGWYLNPECTGEKYDFTGKTMPVGAENNTTSLVLYAKWVPVTYKVRFFLSEDLMKTGQDEMTYTPTLAEGKRAIFESVPHGAQIDQEFVDAHLDYNAMTVNGGVFYPYTFVAWFYYDEAGVKHPFEPKTQIKQNMDIFAEWSSDVLIPYTIKYAVPKMENGVRVVDYYVAADTTGSALAGTSKTFEAKGGADLFEGYQTGCFPETESNTIKFEVAQAQTGVEYIFWYTPQVKVPYKVYYVTETQDDENPLAEVTIDNRTYYQLNEPKEVKDNENVVVTETFVTVPGYMPDAYQKRLIVSNDGNPNNDVIIFIYTKDEVHTYYRVTHYIENPDDVDGQMTWTEYTSSQFVGDIGVTDQYNDTPLQIAGFEWEREEYTVGSTAPVEGSPDGTKLTADGMQINLYYTRKDYPYKVQYLLENSTTKLLDPKTGREKFEKTVVESAPTGEDYPALEQYELVTSSPQTLTIRIEEGEDPKLNVITFYYREKQATLYYEAVGPENAAADFGVVSPASEQISILSGIASGSTASAGNHYTFEGWYKDAECQQPVDASWVQNGKITPQKPGDVWPETTTYYAKFVETEVTINYVVVGPEGCGKVEPASEKLPVLTGTADGSTATAQAGYTFLGWYDNPACEGAALSTNPKYVPTKDADATWVDGTTYYAKFVENEATINYVVVGPEGCGTVDQASEKLPVLTGTAVGSTATAEDGYAFLGWYDNPACEGTALSTNPKYVPTKDADAAWVDGTKYYAKFVENEVSLYYAVVTGCEQMGSVSPKEEIVKVLTGTAKGSTATAEEYYEFVGWYENSNGSGDPISTSTTFVPTKDADAAWQDGKTWYAKFREKKATINYVAVGNGTVEPASEQLDQLMGVAVGSSATAGEHYRFVGWYSDAACSVPVDSAWVENDKITPVKANGTAWPDTTTYYAKFEDDEVTITYVSALRDGQTVTVANGMGGLVILNDGESRADITTSEMVKVSSATAAGATAVKNENYKFIGWYSDAACTQQIATAEGFVPVKVNGLNMEATYYALFEIDVADLIITKTVNGKENPPTAPFELTISLPDAAYNYTSTLGAVSSEGMLMVTEGTGTLAIRDGEEITIHDVVIGSAYAVEEEDLPWFAETIAASGAQIAAEGNLVTITNTYQTGTLSVTKRVDVQSGVAAPPANLEFEFEVLLENAPLGASVSVSIGNTAPQYVALNDGKLTFKLMHGQTATIYDLPVGTDYQVTEVNVPDNFVVTYDNHAAGKIIDGSIETIVINNYPARYAELTVTKAGLQASKESAVVDVVITTNNVSTTYTLVLNQSNSSATITHIPVGSNYTVTERDAWTWQYKDTTAQSGAIVDGGSTVRISNSAESDKWLHDESYLVNNINTGGSSGVNN